MGRPKGWWVDCLDEGRKANGLSIHGKREGRQRLTLEEIARDQEKWKDVIELSVTGNSRKMMS